MNDEAATVPRSKATKSTAAGNHKKPAPRSRLEALKQRQAEIAERIRQLEQQGNAQRRKADTRLKILIGAAMLADLEKTAEHSPEAAQQQKQSIRALLHRAIVKKKDREFLHAIGWLSDNPLP